MLPRKVRLLNKLAGHGDDDEIGGTGKGERRLRTELLRKWWFSSIPTIAYIRTAPFDKAPDDVKLAEIRQSGQGNKLVSPDLAGNDVTAAKFGASDHM